MKSTIKIFIFSSLFLVNIVYAADGDIFKAFAKYQADRIEQTTIDYYLTDLADERFVNQFFTHTSEKINNFSAYAPSALLYSELKESLKTDQAIMKGLSKCLNQQVNSDLTNITTLKTTLETLDWLITLKTTPEFSVQDFIFEQHTLLGVDSNACAINEAQTATAKWLAFKQAHKNDNNGNEFEPTQVFTLHVDQLDSTRISNIEEIKKSLSDTEIKDVYKFLWFIPTGVIPNENIAKGTQFLNLLSAIKKFEVNGSNSYTTLTLQLISTLEALGFEINNRSEFKKFLKASLFLAKATDLQNVKNQKNSEAISDLIRTFVNEDVAYKNKTSLSGMYIDYKEDGYQRCNWLFTCKNTLFLGSYYGLAIGKAESSKFNELDWEPRAFGPLGLEFKLVSGSVNTYTIMLAPLDFGTYITNELKGDEYEANIEDIVSPSVFLSISPKRTPLSFQIGFQKDIPAQNDDKYDMSFVSMSYDLPIATIW